MKRKHYRLWQKDWTAGFLIILLFFLLVLLDNPLLEGLERWAYDIGVRVSQRPADADIVLVAIDEKSIDGIGPWPWSGDTHAQLINKLGSAKIVGNTVKFSQSISQAGQQKVRDLRLAFNNSSLKKDALADVKVLQDLITELSRDAIYENVDNTLRVRNLAAYFSQSALSQRLPRDVRGFDVQLKALENSLNLDNLQHSIKQADNVSLAMYLQPGAITGKPNRVLPDGIRVSAPGRVLSNNDDAETPTTFSARFPPGNLADVARGIGVLGFWPDSDGTIRQEPLLWKYDNYYLPSFSLLLAARSLGLKTGDLGLISGQAIALGKLRIETDKQFRMHTFFYSAQGSDPVFPQYAFVDVLKGEVPAQVFRDKIVLIGVTANGLSASAVTPVAIQMPAVVVLAHAVSSILNGHYFSRSLWTTGLEWMTFLLIALYLILLLPRLSAALAATITAVLLCALLFTHYVLMTQATVWVKLMLPILMLLAGHLLLNGIRRLLTAPGTTKLPEYPDRQQAARPDAKRHIAPIPAVEQNMIFGAHHDQAPDLAAARLDESKTMLGRYQVEKELGRGSMGVVYLGRDPKIDRIVAIKTLDLLQTFNPDDRQEIKSRFFREARAAGRLRHPNIVTIYDAGEAGDLAYIAMEYLRGKDLSSFTRPGHLLPLNAAINMVIKAAKALHYAHKHGVVHRDIKPANIMFETGSGLLKITDFGIARITDASKTRTGTVMGTPSYMSPEQITGQKWMVARICFLWG